MAIEFKSAREALSRVRKHPERCLIVHYACQSLYDDADSLSPSISNIIVKNFANDQTVSFAAHIVAEKLQIPRNDIQARFAEIERALLEDFYAFVVSRVGHYWLHWNMINIQYGFETLAHRYYILTDKTAPNIDVDNRINIAGILHGIYGQGYVATPHMPKLMELNGGVRRDFVAGIDEVGLFKSMEYARLHASTVSKVRFFSDVVSLTLDKKLKTAKSTVYARTERALDGVTAKSVGAFSAVYTLIDLIAKAAG